MGAEVTTISVPTIISLERQSSIRDTLHQCLLDYDQKKHFAQRRISISELPILGSLNDAKNLDIERLDPKWRKAARKVARKIAKSAWKGTKVSAKLLFIAPYIPLVLFFVLLDWVQDEIGEYLTKEDVESISDWSTSTLVN